MAGDPSVSQSAVGSIEAGDKPNDLPTLGLVIRSTKCCKIHVVVASSWESELAEAHVFEPTSKAQTRFLNRSVWLKLRKSRGFKKEIKPDDGRTIFIVSSRQETSMKDTRAPVLKPDEPDDTKSVTEEVLLDESTASTLPTNSHLPAGMRPSAVGKSIFLRYLRECHGDESTPAFQSDGFPTTTGLETTKVEADQFEMLESIGPFYDHRPPVVDERLPPEHDSANKTIPASSGDMGTKRSKPRQIPQKRRLNFVLGLAAEIAGESFESNADGVCLFGHGFILEHLYHRPMGFSSSQALFEHAAQQRGWTNRIGRTLQHVPELLKKQEAAAETAWLASLEELRHIFGDQATDAQQSEDQRPQNIVIIRWIVERSFSGFGPEAIAKLADPFACYTCDREPITKWMLRIRSHARMRQWAREELLKAPEAPERANPVLMRLLEAHTAHELVLGMRPLLERMHNVSQEELGYWEETADFLHGKEEAENTGHSLVVTDPTTTPALIGLTMGERTGSRIFQWVWSYVLGPRSGRAQGRKFRESWLRSGWLKQAVWFTWIRPRVTN
ncbi:hypothetical protein B0T11DRAFT_274324 [Plectosphaerella cucumerina]|uniref:Uncharacterized protein n=1 Tax=Plectosphaerella cucumerina TaxID=40658 RepID=A0A8K0X4K2_9PEZI|nr:hypothetical protein B0T11DRAFT_274324 [Plectosphaerella cucumerina]